LKQGLKMATIGAAKGLFGAWATQKLISGALFGISAADPVTLTGAAFFLLMVAAIASAIPGVRVLRSDPARTSPRLRLRTISSQVYGGPIRKLSARVLASRSMSIPACVGHSYGFVKMYPKQTESGAIGESAARDYRKRKEV
jgi:hypothetical protein